MGGRQGRAGGGGTTKDVVSKSQMGGREASEQGRGQGTKGSVYIGDNFEKVGLKHVYEFFPWTGGIDVPSL